MKETIKNIGKHSIIYGIGSALSMAAGFLLIPLYTNVLTTIEYGILELLNRSADIIILIMFMGVRQAYIRFYFDRKDTEWHKTVTATSLLFVIISSLVICFAIFPFKGLLSIKIFKSSNVGELFVLLLIWLPFETVVNIGLTHLQIQMRSLFYVAINFIKMILLLGSNIFLVYYLRNGIAGVLISNVWVAGLIATSFLFFIVKWSKMKISLELMGQLVKFGLPFVPSTFFMFIICNSDRYLMSIFGTLDEVGIYALGYKIGMLGTMLLMEPFQKVWAPFLFSNYKKENGTLIVGKVFTLFTLVTASFCLLVAIASPVIIPYISGQAFHSASKLIPLICLASLFYGMACIADAGILISKKTNIKPLIFGSAGITSLMLNWFLIPKFGATGAAISLSITFFILLILTYRISSKYFPFAIEYRKIILIFLGSLITFLFSSVLISMNLKWYSLISFTIFPFILWGTGYFSRSEKADIKRFIGNISPGSAVSKPSD